MKNDRAYWVMTIGRRAQPTINKCIGIDCSTMQFHITGNHLLVETYMLAHCKGWFVVVDTTLPKNFEVLSLAELRELYLNSFGHQAAVSKTIDQLCIDLQEASVDVQVCTWTQVQLNQLFNTRRAQEVITLAPLPKPIKVLAIVGNARAHTARTGNTSGHPTPQARPKPYTATGRVWELCDKAFEVVSSVTDWKSFKKSVLASCSKELINESTGSVQFGKWKLNKGL